MKGHRKHRRSGFSLGNDNYKRRNVISKENEIAGKYVRLDKRDFEALCRRSKDGVIYGVDADGQMASVRLLRPKSSKMCKSNGNEDKLKSDGDVYKLHHQGLLQTFFNDCFKEHRDLFPTCDGDLFMDRGSEVKMGLCWKEKMICSKCTFISECKKLYYEVAKDGRGVKPAIPNIGIQVGLSQSMISNTACRRILMSAHIPAPCMSAMQKNTNTVHEKIVRLNESDMSTRRRQLHANNELLDLPRDAPIRVEADGRYNNSLQSGAGKTLFQAGTQAVYTMVENQTCNKQIIAISTQNKLCTTAAKMKNLGLNVICPDHEGHCTRTYLPETSIGNEALMAETCIEKLITDDEPTFVKYVTLDGDSTAFTGICRASERLRAPVEPQRLSDTRHLSQSQCRQMAKASWSSTMFPGKTKCEREKLMKRFCLDVTKQCTSAYERCYSDCIGDQSMMVHKLSFATDAMIECYSGNHDMCRRKSYTCPGLRKKWNMPFLPVGCHLELNAEDKRTLRKCIDYKLGRVAVTRQKFNTNSQKAESINRSYTSTNPKCVTMCRNFVGRVHSAAHSLNNGPGTSIALKLEAVGAPLPVSSRIRSQLKSDDNIFKNNQENKKLRSTKIKRLQTVSRNFAMYDNNSNKNIKMQNLYRKGRNDPKLVCPTKTDHSYSK